LHIEIILFLSYLSINWMIIENKNDNVLN